MSYSGYCLSAGDGANGEATLLTIAASDEWLTTQTIYASSIHRDAEDTANPRIRVQKQMPAQYATFWSRCLREMFNVLTFELVMQLFGLHLHEKLHQTPVSLDKGLRVQIVLIPSSYVDQNRSP